MKTLLQIFEENKLLDSSETENLIKRIDQIIEQDKQKQNTMNTVTFYKHNVRIQEFTFATEKEAVDCMLRHASEKGLEVSPNYDEAYSQGNIPELLIIVNEA